jgi:hypothetical protein
MSPLKIKIPSKNMRENQQIHQLFIQFLLGTLPEYDNVMPKRVGATILN